MRKNLFAILMAVGVAAMCFVGCGSRHYEDIVISDEKENNGNRETGTVEDGTSDDRTTDNGKADDRNTDEGTTDNNGDNGSKISEPVYYNNIINENVILTLCDFSDNRITYSIENKSSEEIYYGADFSLYKKEGDGYILINPREPLCWIQVIYTLAPGETVTDLVIDLSYYEKLEPGVYRIDKSRGLILDFEIK